MNVTLLAKRLGAAAGTLVGLALGMTFIVCVAIASAGCLTTIAMLFGASAAYVLDMSVPRGALRGSDIFWPAARTVFLGMTAVFVVRLLWKGLKKLRKRQAIPTDPEQSA